MRRHLSNMSQVQTSQPIVTINVFPSIFRGADLANRPRVLALALPSSPVTRLSLFGHRIRPITGAGIRSHRVPVADSNLRISSEGRRTGSATGERGRAAIDSGPLAPLRARIYLARALRAYFPAPTSPVRMMEITDPRGVRKPQCTRFVERIACDGNRSPEDTRRNPPYPPRR
jgi:hypothetical protein